MASTTFAEIAIEKTLPMKPDELAAALEVKRRKARVLARLYPVGVPDIAIAAMSRRGGAPNMRAYSRLNCEALS